MYFMIWGTRTALKENDNLVGVVAGTDWRL